MRISRLHIGIFLVSLVCIGAISIGATAIITRVGMSELRSRIGLTIALLRMKKAPSGPPPALFKQYLLNPIPPSVTEIKADRTSAIFGYGYTFRFKISRADLELIIKSLPFKKVKKMRFMENDCLNWDLEAEPGGIMMVYAPDQHKPKWFRPEAWDKPEAYVVPLSQGNVYILIYNEELGEAYAIVRGGG